MKPDRPCSWIKGSDWDDAVMAKPDQGLNDKDGNEQTIVNCHDHCHPHQRGDFSAPAGEGNINPDWEVSIWYGAILD